MWSPMCAAHLPDPDRLSVMQINGRSAAAFTLLAYTVVTQLMLYSSWYTVVLGREKPSRSYRMNAVRSR